MFKSFNRCVDSSREFNSSTFEPLSESGPAPMQNVQAVQPSRQHHDYRHVGGWFMHR
jgi:hypothetical protein